MKWRVLWLCLLLLGAAGAACLWRQEQVERKFWPQIHAAATRYNVDPLLVRAIVWRETRFHPSARGSKGELGLMQVQEPAAREWAEMEHVENFNHTQCLDAVTNTLAGTFYLAKLLKRYARTGDAVPYALADYNAGRSNVLKWNTGAASTNSAAFVGQIGYGSTRRYLKSVLRRYALYKFVVRWERL